MTGALPPLQQQEQAQQSLISQVSLLGAEAVSGCQSRDVMLVTAQMGILCLFYTTFLAGLAVMLQPTAPYLCTCCGLGFLGEAHGCSWEGLELNHRTSCTTMPGKLRTVVVLLYKQRRVGIGNPRCMLDYLENMRGTSSCEHGKRLVRRRTGVHHLLVDACSPLHPDINGFVSCANG
jgi:hypothetical protein